MVVHSPPPKSKGAAGTTSDAAREDQVPPSVLAASNTAQVSPEAGLLDTGDAVAHDFAAWNGINPPGTRRTVQVDVHHNPEPSGSSGSSGTDSPADQQDVEDPDKIAVAAGLADSNPRQPPPPPPPAGSGSGNFPPINPFAPEWFA